MSEAGMVSANNIGTVRLINAASKVLAKASDMLVAGGLPDKTGGYLAWTDSNGTLLSAFMWGFMPMDKAAKRQKFALEKTTRLALHNLHRTSYRSRNPKEECWGGAIRAGEYILSFSGFPEKWDEAAMFVLAIKLSLLHRDDVFRHISPKRNPHLRPLLEACHWTE